jgi:hypothetical protein
MTLMPEVWPQPHEGIIGADRDDVPHREALIAMAYHLRTATLVGQPAPVVARMGERMRQPQPGDLVVTTEVLHGRRDLEDRIHGFGIYLAGRTEWAETDENWAAMVAEDQFIDDGDRTTDTVFYIQYGPSAGDICRWYNSGVVVLPSGEETFSLDAAASRDGDATTFTRDSLLAGLADSGFHLRDPDVQL